ncbi:MAG: glycosyltransferase family 2 protein [Candidatus Gastranaerophilales bacterium]|nr:glycosyltransferase family 2 protein [Candidatus Gastranaerophilales bacterium]
MTIDFSIIIPVFNEENNIIKLHSKIKKNIEKITSNYEIIYINDASTDSSLEKLQYLFLHDPNLKIINFTKNFGQTSALKAGFDYAKGKFIFTLDADLQNDPEDFIRLLNKYNEGYDLVCGWRKNRHDDSLRKKVSLCANFLIRKLFALKIHDLGCTLRIYNAQCAKSLYLKNDFHRFIPVLAKINKAKITEIEVSHHKRYTGYSKYGLNRTFKVLRDIFIIYKELLFFNTKQPKIYEISEIIEK